MIRRTTPPRSGKVDRMLRVNELVKRELAGLLERYPAPELSGVLVSVTEADCSIDLRTAAVFISVFGGKDSDRASVTRHLAKMRPEFQHRLATALKFKHTPVLNFIMDDRQAAGDRVLEILRQEEKKRPASPEDGKSC